MKFGSRGSAGPRAAPGLGQPFREPPDAGGGAGLLYPCRNPPWAAGSLQRGVTSLPRAGLGCEPSAGPGPAPAPRNPSGSSRASHQKPGVIRSPAHPQRGGSIWHRGGTRSCSGTESCVSRRLRSLDPDPRGRLPRSAPVPYKSWREEKTSWARVTDDAFHAVPPALAGSDACSITAPSRDAPKVTGGRKPLSGPTSRQTPGFPALSGPTEDQSPGIDGDSWALAGGFVQGSANEEPPGWNRATV